MSPPIGSLTPDSVTREDCATGTGIFRSSLDQQRTRPTGLIISLQLNSIPWGAPQGLFIFFKAPALPPASEWLIASFTLERSSQRHQLAEMICIVVRDQ